MDTQLILSVILLPLLTQVSADKSRCPSSGMTEGYIYDRGEWCYQFIFSPQRDWYEARELCSGRGGRLVNLNDYHTAAWVRGIMQNTLNSHFGYNGIWIGLHDRGTEGHYYWDALPGESEKPASYSYWQSGEPNDLWFGQDCVYMRKGYGYRWVDVSCSGRDYSIICEYKKNPLPTTTTTTTTSTTTTPSTTQPTTTTTVKTTTPTTTTPTTTTPSTTATTTTRPTTTSSTTIKTTIPSTTQRSTTQSTVKWSTTQSTSQRTMPSTTTTTQSTPKTTVSTVVMSSSSTTQKTTTEDKSEPPVIIPEVPGNSGLGEDTGQIAETGAAHGKGNEQGGDQKVTHIAVGLLVALIIAITIIIILVLRRRRKRKEQEVLNVQLENPCYRAGQLGAPICTNNLSSNTGTCTIQPNGNVYVEFNNQRDLNVYEDAEEGAAFAGELHLDVDGNKTQSPRNHSDPRLERDDCCGAAAGAIPIDAADECAANGYMATNHIYADIGESEPHEMTAADYSPYDLPEISPTRSAVSPTGTTKHDELTVNMDHSKTNPKKSFRKNPLYDDTTAFRQNPLYDTTLSGSPEDNTTLHNDCDDESSNVYAVPANVNVYDTPRPHDSAYDVPSIPVEVHGRLENPQNQVCVGSEHSIELNDPSHTGGNECNVQ